MDERLGFRWEPFSEQPSGPFLNRVSGDFDLLLSVRLGFRYSLQFMPAHVRSVRPVITTEQLHAALLLLNDSLKRSD